VTKVTRAKERLAQAETGIDEFGAKISVGQKIDAMNNVAQAEAELTQFRLDNGQRIVMQGFEQRKVYQDMVRDIEALEAELRRMGMTAGQASAALVAFEQQKDRRIIALALQNPNLEPHVEEAYYRRLNVLDAKLMQARATGRTTDIEGGPGGLREIAENLREEEERAERSRKAGAISGFAMMEQIGAARVRALAGYQEKLVELEALQGREDTFTQERANRIRELRREIELLAGSVDVLGDSFATAFEEGLGATLEKLTTGQIRSFKDLLKSLGQDLFGAINKRVIDNISGSLFGPKGMLRPVSDAFASLFRGRGGVKPEQAAAPVSDAIASFTDVTASAVLPMTAASTATTKLAGSAGTCAIALDYLTASAGRLVATQGGDMAAKVAEKLIGTAITSGAGAGGSPTSVDTAVSYPYQDVGAGMVVRPLHTGGIVGMSSRSRVVPMNVFARAPRLHRGGYIGRDEVAVIAQRGEGIFTQAQMSQLAPVGSASAQRPVNVYNQFTLTQPADRRTQSQVAVQAGFGVRRAMKRDA
jgi:hypothetical protein